MSLDSKLQRILSDHIEQMSKDLVKISNKEDKFVFKIYERKLLMSICEKVTDIFKKEPSVLKLKGDCIVVGDLHGHIIDLYRIFTIFDLPPKTTYLFLGDIVDRGGFSIETITLLFVLKLLYPKNIYLIRGNHEFNTTTDKENKNIGTKYLNSFKDQIDNVYGLGFKRGHSSSFSQIDNFLLSQKKFTSNDSTENQTPPIIPNKPNVQNQPTKGVLSTPTKPGLPLCSLNRCILKAASHNNKGAFNTSLENNSNESGDFDNAQQTSNKLQIQKNPLRLTYTPSNGYSEHLYNSFCSAFSYIPLVAMFGETIICLHGGIGGNFTNVKRDIVPLERPIMNYENNIVENVLWSDPMAPEKEEEFKNINFMTSPRGRGCVFGKAALDTFMNANHLSLMIRAHEVIEEGIRIQYDSKLITVFSASSYINLYGNKSGVLKISKNNKVTTYSFPPFNFLSREAAYFMANGGNDQGNKLGLPFTYTLSSTGITPCGSNLISSSNSNLEDSESNILLNSNPNESFYHNSTNNNFSTTNLLTKIVNKTVLSTDKKLNILSQKTTSHSNQMQANSTRRRIKFTQQNAKSSNESPDLTFS